MPDLEREKAAAAARAVAMVTDGMRVGLGTGSTAAYAVKGLGERVRQGLRIVGIPTSERTRELAQEVGIPLTDFEATDELDLAIDGTDEADRELRLIKGGGGALLRERIVASTARRFVVIADSQKLVATLGRYPLPVEVVRFAVPLVARAIGQMGATPKLRRSKDGAPYVTDEGNHIVDAHFGVIRDPERIALRLTHTPGVVDHGLFLNMAHTLVLARGDTVELIERA